LGAQMNTLGIAGMAAVITRAIPDIVPTTGTDIRPTDITGRTTGRRIMALILEPHITEAERLSFPGAAIMPTVIAIIGRGIAQTERARAE
jgi:hypothetical protein